QGRHVCRETQNQDPTEHANYGAENGPNEGDAGTGMERCKDGNSVVVAWLPIFGWKFAPRHNVVRPSSYVSLPYSAVTNACLHRGPDVAVRHQLAGLGDRASGFARPFLHRPNRFCGLALR